MVKDQQKIHIDESSSWLRGLRGVCKDIMADGVVTEQEFYSLYTWLISCPCTHVYPFNVLAEQVELILLDGVVTAEELEAFKHVLESLFSATNDAPAVQTSPFVTPDTAYYEVINLEQGSKAWLDWRHGGIGASDASTIMGENPWKSASQLLREKRAGVQASRPNAAMARGTALEPEARRKFIQKYGIEVQPACLQSLQHDWMRASLDGISKDGTVVAEIKCGESVYRQSVQNRCAPDYYYGQLQHILAVTGLPSLQFFCYLPGRSEVMLQIERDDAYIDQLIRAERDFWQKVLV